MKTRLLLLGSLALAGVVIGCGGPNEAPDAFVEVDGGPPPGDGGHDAGRDGGPPRDAGRDTGPEDGGMDAFVEDAFVPVDAFMGDAGPCAPCDDGLACNGVETCDLTTLACLPGTPLDCNDGMACTVDSCDDATGCVFAPGDSDTDGDDDCVDCAPMNSAIHSGATEVCNAMDDNCNGVTDEGVATPIYADCDGDGWATETAVSFDGCPPPPVADTGCGTAEQAWTTRVADPTDFDCADDDARAHSMTTGYHTTAIASAFPDTDFDFNCDFVEEQQFAVQGSCVGSTGSCVTTSGWQAATIPECGDAAVFIAGCTVACVPSTETRTQACR